MTTTDSPAALVWARLLALPHVDDATAMQALDMVMEEVGCERAEAFRLLCGAAADGLDGVRPTPDDGNAVLERLRLSDLDGCGWYLQLFYCYRDPDRLGSAPDAEGWLDWCDAAGRAVAILRTLQGVG